MEIPASLRAWFVADFVVTVMVAVPLILVPEEILPRLGWVAVDPISARLAGAALLAMGVQSWRTRRGGAEAYRSLLGLKVVWSTTAIVGLTIAIARGAPAAAFLLLSIFLGFSGVWSHYAIRLRQQAAADERGGPSSSDDDAPAPADDLDHPDALG